MRRIRSNIAFYLTVAVCNVMVWGMFNILNMPRSDSNISAITSNNVPVYRAPAFVPTVGNPVRVVIPEIGLDVNVKDGSFDPNSQTWTIDDTSAFFAQASVPANDNNGTTLLYGHARSNMFEPLKNIASTATVQLYTDNGKLFTYTFESMREVIPSDTSVFTADGPPTLVMQTCSGPWDKYRALYSFTYVSVRSV